MYLVPADHYHKGDKRLGPSPRERKKRSNRHNKHKPSENWVKIRHKIREAAIRRKTRTKAIPDFLRRVMRDTTNRELPSAPEPELSKQLIVPKVAAKMPRRSPLSPIPSTLKEMENPKQGFIPGDNVTEEEDEENVETVASPAKSIRSFLDTQYGIRRDGDHLLF